MNFRAAASFIILALVCLLVGLWYWHSPVPAKPVPPKQTAQKKGVLMVRSDLNWKDLKEEELREFTTHFENKKERVISKIETLVADGETVITEAYESAPGEFIFSSITPTLTTLKAGHFGSPSVKEGDPGVHIEVKCFKMSVSGDMDMFFSKGYDQSPKDVQAISVLRDDGNDNLSVRSKPDETFPMIRLQAESSKSVHKRESSRKE